MAAQLRIAGIPVRIDPSLLLILALLGLSLEDPWLIAAWVAIGVGSVLLHELGHALAYRRFGQRATIVLYAFGGITQGEGALSPARSLGVSLAGPGSQLLLLGLPLVAVAQSGAVQDPFWQDVLGLGLYINIGWPLMNLIPVLPLDGGNVVRSSVELVLPGRGMRAAQWVSVVVAGLGAVVAAAYGLLFLAAFGALFAVVNWKALGADQRSGDVDPIVEGYGALLRGDVSGGRLAATRLAGSAPGAAEELRLWSLVAEGDARRLTQALRLQPAGFEPSALLRGAAALLEGDAANGGSLVAWSLVHEPVTPAIALVVDLLAPGEHLHDVTADLLALDDPVRAVRTLQAALHQRGWYRQSAAVGAALIAAPLRLAMAAAVQADVGADVAASSARAGEVATAEAWLTWAVGAGWHDLGRLEHDPDLELLRSSAIAAQLQRTFGVGGRS